MAKNILWFMFIIGALLVVVLGNDTEMFTKIVLLSILCVLALCESIEKGVRNGQRSVSKHD